MARDMGRVDVVRALFRDPVCASEPTFGKARSILADLDVAVGFGIRLVRSQPAYPFLDVQVSLRGKALEDLAAGAPGRCRGRRLVSAGHRRVSPNEARISREPPVREFF